MREFNLLPWRSELREKRKRDYLISIAICAGTSLLIVALIHWMYFLKLQNQNDKNNYLTNQIKILDKQIVEIKELEKKKRKSDCQNDYRRGVTNKSPYDGKII